MADRTLFRHRRWWALLIGVLVAAWTVPATAHATGSAVAVEAPAATEATTPVATQAAAALVTLGHGAWVPPHLLVWTPVAHRSPSWHRGTGRRQHRLGDQSPLPAPSGSIPASGSFNLQAVVSAVRSFAPSQGPGRCALSPRAPPTGN